VTVTEFFAGIPCRECGQRMLRLEWWHEGYAPIRKGQPPVMIEWPYCVCDGCGAVSRGKPPPDSVHAYLEMNAESLYSGPFRCE
jgi:hypothetical protein